VQFNKETHFFGSLYFQVTGAWIVTVMTTVRWRRQSLKLFL